MPHASCACRAVAWDMDSSENVWLLLLPLPPPLFAYVNSLYVASNTYFRLYPTFYIVRRHRRRVLSCAERGKKKCAMLRRAEGGDLGCVMR